MVEQRDSKGKGAPAEPSKYPHLEARAGALDRPPCPRCRLRSGEWMAGPRLRCLMPLCAHRWPGTPQEHDQAFQAELAYAMTCSANPGRPLSAFQRQMERIRFYVFALTSINCAHPTAELRAKVRVDGVLMRGYQCLVCGAAATGPRMGRASPPAATLPRWDEGLWDRHRAEIVPQYEAWIERMRAERSALWWRLYTAYLDSPAWAALRQQVIARDGGRCRACGAPGEHVHHLTYQRVTEEDLSDLTLLCAPCHADQHPTEAPDHA